MSLDITLKKIRHLKDFLNHIKYFFLYSYHVNFILWNKIKNVLQKEIKDLPFEISDPSAHFFLKILSYKGPNIYDVHTERGWGGLQMVLFKQQIYCSFFVDGGLVGGWGVVCGRHNCMVPNIETYFDEKGNICSFGASVTVKQPSLPLNVSTFK